MRIDYRDGINRRH